MEAALHASVARLNLWASAMLARPTRVYRLRLSLACLPLTLRDELFVHQPVGA
jgi:hypothetical protein